MPSNSQPPSPDSDAELVERLALLVRATRGGASEIDQITLQRLVAEHASDARLAAALTHANNVARHPVTSEELHERVIALQAQLSTITVAQRERDLNRDRERVPRGLLGRWERSDRPVWQRVTSWGVAVVAVLLIVLTARHFTPFAMHPSVHVYATTTGQTRVVGLEDGSRVTLGPESRLQVIVRSSGERTAQLRGEGYFDIARSHDAPFIVESQHASTRVLGTSFLVRESHGKTVVAVTDGRVLVHSRAHPSQAAIVTAGNVGDVTDSTLGVVTSDDMSPYTSWMNGQLVFHDATTRDVLATLARWYGLTFEVADSSLASQHWTTGLSTQSASEALTTLKLLLDVDLQFRGNVVILVPRSKPDHHGSPSPVDGGRPSTPHYNEVGR